jgi:uncharacterized protein YutE (UPF0331/DUF86 family)
MDDVVFNKAAIVERSVARARAVFGGDAAALRDDLLRQDSIVLNLQRACEATIDLAMHLVRRERLGLPQRSRDAFDLLVAAGWTDAALGDALKRMVGFRNIAVHEYTRLDLDVVQSIVETGLDHLLAFTAAVLRRA